MYPSSEGPKNRGASTPAPPVGRFRLAGMGVQFAAVICVFALGGYWLDRWLGSLPVFLIVGVLVGFLGGTFSMVKKVSAYRNS